MGKSQLTFTTLIFWYRKCPTTGGLDLDRQHPLMSGKHFMVFNVLFLFILPVKFRKKGLFFE